MRWERLPLQHQGAQLSSNSNGPGKRWGHSCNSVKGGRFLYVFGGYGQDNCQTNHVHVFDTALQSWSQPEIKGTPPTPRDSHSCTTVADNLFVFGGTDGINPLNDLHIFETSTNTWISPTVRGDGPAAREGHSAALVGKRLFIFGGCGKFSVTGDEIYYNDLYILNTETFVWKEAITSGIPPSPRDSHTCSSWKNNIIVIGGEDGLDYYLSDVHILDAETLAWKELSTAGQRLTPRAGHSTVAFGKKLFVFGGFADSQNLYDDLYLLDIDVGVWTKVVTAGTGPSGRFSAGGDCLDPQMGGVIVFLGGCNKSLEALDDMYYLHTGIASVRDERRPEKLSLRKQLKIKCQEQNLNSPLHNKVRENLQFEQGKKAFNARVTESFPHGYTIETIIDGKLLRGIIFANKPLYPENLNKNNIRRRAAEDAGGDHPNESKTSRTDNNDKHDDVEHIQADRIRGKEIKSHESKAETVVFTELMNLEIPPNPEPSVAPLNLNDEMICDVPNSNNNNPKHNFILATDSISLSLKQDGGTATDEVANDPSI